MNSWMAVVLAFFLVTNVLAEAPRNESYLPMPPKFSVEADRDQVLKEYPLGVITKMAAFSHHGQPHRTVELPNGLDGWVYENVLKNQRSFQMPAGQKREMESMEDAHLVSTFTLVFDTNGKVIDVLYREPGNGRAGSALLSQRAEKADVEKELWRPGQ